jgi:UDP-N-acetylglucosamine--N-acetylmuramyl-(pentapeptide) pyrophosphoryl-undecaprenol N-acetylglucosamine transferase
MQLQQHYNAEILYLGSDDGLETRLVPATGLRLKTIQAGKLQRYVSWHTVTGIARIPVGMTQAVSIVRSFRPDVAFTSGGYVAVPAGLAARIHGVPFLMHQQDVPPNLSNKLLAPLATRISVAFADSQRFFPVRKTLHLGNPIRQAILDVRTVSPQQACANLGLTPDLPLVLVTGGSQGARHLNQTVCHTLPELLQQCQVLQISGSNLYEETKALADEKLAGIDEETRQRYRLEPYMDAEMALALQAAEIVLCRSGASVLSELAVLSKPSILVPLPPAIGSSPQEANAAMFQREGAAEVIVDNLLKPELLLNRVTSILSQPARLQAMSEAATKLAKPNATQAIVEAIVTMAKGTVAKTPSTYEVTSI